MPEHLMRGMTAEDLRKKRFIRLHYSADPAKDEVWAREERANEADPRNWDKQMEMRRVVTDGIPVFARYVDTSHCPAWTHTSYLELVSGSVYFGGWDAGQTLSPAFVLKELTPDLVVRDLLEVVSTSGESMEEFAPRVLACLTSVYPSIVPLIRHRGDATIVTRSGPDKTTAQQVARRYGLEIKPMTNDWTKRSSAVAFLLNLSADRYVVSGFGCPVLRRGFLGMYKFQVDSRGEGNGAGAVVLSPLKNAYSHVQDANQYASLEIFDLLKPGALRGGLKRVGGGWA